MEDSTFRQRREPYESTDNEDDEGVGQEAVVEDDKTNSDMICLNDSTDRDHKCC